MLVDQDRAAFPGGQGKRLTTGKVVQPVAIVGEDGLVADGGAVAGAIGSATTDTVNVLVAGGLVAAANASRDVLILSVPSTHTDPVWFSLDAAPAVGKGLEVLPGGFLMVGRRAALAWFGVVYAISATAVALGRTEVNRA